MAISDVKAVLEFLRNSGLSGSESALMEDIIEKTHLGSSDFQKFLFPMVPPPPPLKIPVTRRLPEASGDGDGGDYSSGCSSHEEFVSLGSSTTELCSSEFTNPYGVGNTTRPSSRASSDRLSQFGTARDYHDFDMQNNILWYKEKEEDYLMPHHFRGSDSAGDPSEDKFVLTVETGKQAEPQLSLNYLGRELRSNGITHNLDDGKDDIFKDNFYIDNDNEFQCGGIEKGEEGCMVYTCSSPLCACYNTGKLLAPDIGNYNITPDLKKDPGHEDENYSPEDYREMADEPHEPNSAAYEETIATTDELLMYETNEDNYEVFNLRIIHRKNKTGFEENKDLPIVLNSIIAGRYYVTEYLGSAAFSKVVQAHDLHTRMDVCLKIIKNDKDFFDQSLDEIKLLKFVNKHDPGDECHILRLYDYFYHQEHLFIVCELLGANLYEFHKYNQESGGEPYFTLGRLQVIAGQCLEALEFLHGLGVIHCDLKPENILIKSYQGCEVKVIDLGSSCFQTDNLSLYVQSRSYRAPEVILGLPYDQKIDLWSLGCILAELFSGEVLFANETIVMMLARMVGLLGPIDMDMLLKGQDTDKYFTNEFDLYHINEETNQLECIIPEKSNLENHLQNSDPEFIDFVKSLLELNPERRPTAREALQHPWLTHSY